MESLKKIYTKPIDREIQGVIKVDDESFIGQELEEYVVTEELLKHFNSFFSAYNIGINSTTEKMGVWISGFFGSGKSHFLKIISYLLENKVVAGKTAVDYFDTKIDDKMLLADIKRAGNVPTDVILFNIDSKSSQTVVDSKDKILAVFEKVFNEKMGLSTIPHVAELERFLIKQNRYNEFEICFKEECGEDWNIARNDFYFRRDEIVNSYSKAMDKSKEEAENWFDKAEERYELSIEKFAERVRDYIEAKGDNHHVVFLVDEIGQYIGSDTSLMLSLQTIVEDLGIECGGKSWVIVTSQRAIDNYVKVEGNDFSKIQGRFDTKLSLSSSDVDEVIKKRILDKTLVAKESLKLIYDKKESVITNLLSFTQNTTYQKLYEDNNDFADTYPFISYQFKLLQDVFTGIRKSGYAGMHMSNGERSLINAFQESAKKFADNEIGTLIPFYEFYDTIESFMEPQITKVINNAIDTVKADVLQEIDVKVLKMLFLLKNIKEVPSNIDNLSTLFVSNINDDKITIKKEITDSLRRLEGQILIQRNNEEYKFLTDEEQEINREIKSITVDGTKVSDYLKKIIFDYIFTDSKYTYKKRNFPLTKYIDNIKYSQEYEIGIKIITSSPNRDDTEIIMQSIRNNNYVFVRLEISTLIYEEIENYLKVEEYRRSKSTASQTQQVEDIIRAKQREAEESETRIRENIREQLNVAEIIIAGDRQNINSKDAKRRISESLEVLINNIYSKFNYIERNFEIQDIRNLFHENRSNLFGNEIEMVNSKAYEAMKDYCEEKNALSFTMTIRTLLQNFSMAPYGFLDEDILYILTKLLKDEVITLIYNNEVQNATSEETLTKILKREYYDRTIIKIRQKISLELINDMKSVARNAFNVINLREDEDGMVVDFKEKCLNSTLNYIQNVVANYSYHMSYPYPGKNIVDKVLTVYKKLLEIRDISEFFKEISTMKDELIDLSEKYEPLLDFFKGNQKVQFDKAVETLLIYDNNKDYTDNTEELINVVNKLTNILTKEEPYSDIPELPTLRQKLIDILRDMYNKKSKPIIDIVNNTIKYIDNETKNADVDESFANSYIYTCNAIITTLDHSNELKDIYAQYTRVDQLKDHFVAELESEKNRMKIADEAGKKSDGVKIIPKKIVRADSLMNRIYEINSREDIDKYVEELKLKLIKELDENSNIIIR